MEAISLVDSIATRGWRGMEISNSLPIQVEAEMDPGQFPLFIVSFDYLIIKYLNILYADLSEGNAASPLVGS